MAANSKKTVQNGNSKQEDNAFLRVLHLPMVNSACISLQKTYAITKEAHPLMASVCQAYERGVQSATSLAVWSVKPVVQMLEPQFAAANTLACRGLDHLEQKIPALHKPVEKVTSDLKNSISTHLQSAMLSMADSVDWIRGLAAESYEQSGSTLRDTMEYARSSRVSQLAEAGVDATLNNLEKLVDFLFPKAECKPAESTEAQTLMGSQARNLQTIFLSTISSVTNAPFAAWKAAGELLPISPLKAGSGVSTKVGMVKETLHSITSSLMGTISQYVPLPRILLTAGETAESGQDDEKEPPYPQRDWRRTSRGHLPLPFLNMDDPLPDQAPTQRQSPALEVEHAGTRKSAFSPYKEGAGSRRRSEGFYRPGAESTAYIRAHFAGSYSTTRKY
ncbi:hypothetical protein lerEdw1_010977 [Lerista edwardsae]|nr:hypothetical protein lerEdw1_010977 [Lerista edwardsae]